MADEELVRRLKEGVEGWNELVREARTGERGWRANLRYADLSRANLRRVNLSGAILFSSNLSGANLSSASLSRASFSGADLKGANLFMANVSGADLSSAKLSGAQLSGADLSQSSLSGADLSDAQLSGADLSGADLSDAIFMSADLLQANLSGAYLSSACLSGADLRGANLYNADLSDADLSGARLDATTFVFNDLSRAKGLAFARYSGPSEVGFATLQRSRGKIPDSFLRGCGMAEWEIAAARLYDPDLSDEERLDISYCIADLNLKSPIQPNPVFISYTHDDGRFVDELQAAIDDKGIRSWRDVHHAEAGPLDKVIDRAISLNPTMVLILSEASVESDWVEWEVKRAIELEKELRRPVLCPLALDEAWRGCAWPMWLRSKIENYNVLDYSGRNAIEKQMPRLLKGLNIHYRDRSSP